MKQAAAPASAASPHPAAWRVAIVGAGVAGAACAAGLAGAGFEVTVFDKSAGVGGRMATRQAHIANAAGSSLAAQFDHGCRHFTASRPRFRAVVEGALAAGHAVRWQQHVYATFPSPRVQEVIVPTPDMPAFCRHLLGGVRLQLGRAVTRLHRGADGWWLRLADLAGQAGLAGLEDAPSAGQPAVVDGEGPFDQVVLAIPAAQAASLLRPHRPAWAETLAGVELQPCWTLMAVTDEVDWPWDAADVEQGELAWIGRDDRKPGRAGVGPGLAAWVAHATSAWSREHLEDAPDAVADQLRAALAKLLPGGQPVRWHHAAVHRWRYAQPAQAPVDGTDCWFDAGLGLSVCGDAFGDGTVQAAWCSGDELADTLAAAFEAAADVAPTVTRVPPPALPFRPEETLRRAPGAAPSVRREAVAAGSPSTGLLME